MHDRHTRFPTPGVSPARLRDTSAMNAYEPTIAPRRALRLSLFAAALGAAACSPAQQPVAPAAEASAAASASAAAPAVAASPAGAEAAPGADTQEAIRKTLTARLPQLPKVDEIRNTPIAGLYEIRIGTDVMYSDARGEYLIQGALIDTLNRKDLTAERVDKLSAINVAQLPLKDAMKVRQGTGLRTLVVFADPNCGYCKHFERDMLNVKDVTIYTFLYPILGADSDVKSRAIWCSADPQKTWRAWMIDGKPLPTSADCDTTAIERNVEFGRKHRLNGTPALVFQDGSRLPGAVPAAEVDKLLTQRSGKS
jgi:thiol:disulfide interchange protein DsbC